MNDILPKLRAKGEEKGFIYQEKDQSQEKDKENL